MEILHEDHDLIVCIKPVGVLSQNGKAGEETMVSMLEVHTGGTIYPVHRLDKEVGGVMVYAKTQKTAAFLSSQIQQGTMKKEYLAVVSGHPAEPTGVLTDLLYHDKGKNKSYVVKRTRKGVKEARLSYCVLQQERDKTLVQVRLFTGRTHQIRVQFASRKLPLMGDGRYGGLSGKPALWSVRLTLTMPGGNVRSFFRLPESLGGVTEFGPLAEME